VVRIFLNMKRNGLDRTSADAAADFRDACTASDRISAFAPKAGGPGNALRLATQSKGTVRAVEILKHLPRGYEGEDVVCGICRANAALHNARLTPKAHRRAGRKDCSPINQRRRARCPSNSSPGKHPARGPESTSRSGYGPTVQSLRQGGPRPCIAGCRS
jgi:hypothetical protein